MIDIKELNYTFLQGTVNETRAVSDLNMAIPEGQFIIILGANGSGKTTLLNLLAGSLKPDSGQILIDGKNISNVNEHRRCKLISRIFQNPLQGTAPDLTILENFRLASLRTKTKGLQIGTGKKFRTEVMNHLSALELGLESKLDQLVGSLSGGQRQALTLSMAVMDSSKVLLMDEPTAALDPKTSGIFMKLAQKIVRERKLSTLLITHQLKDALEYGNRLIQMRNGTIIRDIQGDKKSNLTHNEIFSWFGE